MFDFHEKRKIRKVLYSWISIGGIFLLGGLIAYSAYGRYEVEQDMAEKLELREAELAALEERAASLQASVLHLSDERGIEEELRNRFDVAKEGEQVVIILDDGSESSGAASTTLGITPVEEEGILETFRSWIGGE